MSTSSPLWARRAPIAAQIGLGGLRGDDHEIGAGYRFQNGRFTGARKIDEDVIGRARRYRFAKYGCEGVALDGAHGKAGNVRFASPAVDGAVVIKIEDEHLFAPLGEARADSPANRGLADAAF